MDELTPLMQPIGDKGHYHTLKQKPPGGGARKPAHHQATTLETRSSLDEVERITL
jgi:hypothetical protein